MLSCERVTQLIFRAQAQTCESWSGGTGDALQAMWRQEGISGSTTRPFKTYYIYHIEQWLSNRVLGQSCLCWFLFQSQLSTFLLLLIHLSCQFDQLNICDTFYVIAYITPQ